MRSVGLLAAVLLVGAAAAAPSRAANMCQAASLSCATTMPVGGYCECTAHGKTESGTVGSAAPGRRTNATAGGCGAQPNASGCR